MLKQERGYINSEIFAMAGASRQHNQIVTNTVREISLQMKGRPCNVYSNDMRVNIKKTRCYTYPDIAAICGQDIFDEKFHTLFNPALIIEVLFIHRGCPCKKCCKIYVQVHILACI